MPPYANSLQSRRRLSALCVLLFGFGAIITMRLVALQLLDHGHYVALAAGEHQRKYEVPAKRGQIFVRDGEINVPLALNQTLKLLYADPSIITDKPATAAKLAAVTGDPAASYLEALNRGGEYVVLKTKLAPGLAARVAGLQLHGVGLVNQDYRTYPEGALASQVLGFVNNDGEGQYGVEGYLNNRLKGQPGQLNAKTDTSGVPIATADNQVKPPVDGTSVVLTIDRNIQAEAEKYLKEGVDNVKAVSGSVVVMDPATGAVKAMANYPTFDPNSYTGVTDYRVFSNAVTGNQFEPGSGFKVITMSAGLDTGKVKPDTTYNDSGCVGGISGYTICNAANHKDGPGTTMMKVIRDSLNTGAVFVLEMLGGDPNKITPAGKGLLYDYVTKHFGFGVRTGVEQAGEATGFVNLPTSSDINSANMTFGQGISVTMMQMTTAVAAIANGGKLYQPYLVDQTIAPDGTKSNPTTPRVINDHVISPPAAHDMTAMMQVVVEHGSGYLAKIPGYNLAGKTGTAQIPRTDGKGYQDGKNIGAFVGFGPVEHPRYVMMVRINEPKSDGFAEKTTVPVFANISKWLLHYYAVPPSG